MKNKALIKAAIISFTTALSTCPAFAQGWFDAGAAGSRGGSSSPSMQQAVPVSAPGGFDAGLANTFRTGNQGPNAPTGGPQLYGTPAGPGLSSGGESGAVTSAPYVGTYNAPGNMALKGQGLNALPKTTLDSFVDKSSYNEEIYGDEGENGPPPLDDFQPPETGMGPYSDLTTGHNSETPSARKFIRISDLVGN